MSSRDELGVVAAGVLAVLLAICGALGDTPKEPDYNGTWQGTMANGDPIEFTVAQNRVTEVSYWIRLDPNQEERLSRVDMSFELGNEIADGKLKVRAGAELIEIAFKTETSGQGRIVVSRLIYRGGGKHTLLWTATKSSGKAKAEAKGRGDGNSGSADPDAPLEVPVYIGSEAEAPFVLMGRARNARESRRAKGRRDFDWALQTIPVASARRLSGAAVVLAFSRGKGWSIRYPRVVPSKSRSFFVDVCVEIPPAEDVSAVDFSELRLAGTGGRPYRARSFGPDANFSYYGLDEGLVVEAGKDGVSVIGGRAAPFAHLQYAGAARPGEPLPVYLLFEVPDNEIELTLVSAHRRRAADLPQFDTDPETAEPETADPETAEPETAEPEVAAPDTVQPEVAAPELPVDAVKNGMARGEVGEILGRPRSKVQLGAKEVWIYESAKIRFVDGRVHAVEASGRGR